MPIAEDLRYSLRALRHSPGFSITAIATLALGIAASTSIFSVVDAVLLRPLPYDNPSRLFLVLTNDTRPTEDHDGRTTLPDFQEWKSQAHAFQDMTAFFRPGWSRLTLTGVAEPRPVLGAFVDQSFFQVFGVNTAMGRTLSADDVEHSREVMVLSNAMWKDQFGGAGDVLGKTVELEKHKWQVVGVMPEGFAFPFQQTRFWAPVTAHPNWRYQESAKDDSPRWMAAGALKPGVSRREAQAEMNVIAARLEKANPDRLTGVGIRVVPFVEQISATARAPLTILLGAVLVVLLIACVNVANLFLARGASRDRELAVRTALGATKGELVRLLVTESVVVAVAAAIIGVFLSGPAVKVLEALAPVDIPRLDEAGNWNVSVLGFAAALSAVAIVIFGVMPAWRMSPAGPSEGLKEGGRSGGVARASRDLHRILVAAQFALALILLTGSGLLIRSFVAVLETDPGFNPANILTVRASDYPRQVFDRVRALPGVQAVGGVSNLFFDERGTHSLRAIEGRPPEPTATWKQLVWTQINGDYFQAMGIPLLRGRYFSPADTPDTPPVAIVNETMAQRFWPGQDPIGKRLKGFDPRGKNDDWVTVVGLVKDMHSIGIEKEFASQIYEVDVQRGEVATNIVVRTNRDPLPLAGSTRSIIRSLAPAAIVSQVSTVQAGLERQTARRRFQTWLLGVYSAFALLLAAVGVYGVMQYSIARRTHEIGIRMAVGAHSTDVFALVLREGLTLAAWGIAAGLVGALWTARLIEGLLFRVTAYDPVTFGGVAMLLLAAGLAASYLPARRAAQVDPMVALRYE